MKKILLMQDIDSQLPAHLQDQLEAEGYAIFNPRRSQMNWLEEIDQIQPDVLLLEVMDTQYRDCYQLCKQLKETHGTENIPILLLGTTASATKHYLLEGLYAGANDYVQYPCEIPELIGKIQAAFRLKASIEKSQTLAGELNELNEELYHRNLQVEKEMYVARQLQQSLLPPIIPIPEDQEDSPIYTKVHFQNDQLRMAGIYLPCDALGGDLYDVLKFKDQGVGVSITDVSGHGLPAGFITAIFKTILYRVTQMTTDPSEVLFHLNNEMYNIIKTGDYVTSIYLQIDLPSLHMECSGAGHPYPFYYQAATDEIHRLRQNSTPLVWVKDMPYPKDIVQLMPGDKVFLFTDGVSELQNPAGEMYGECRIEAALRQGIDHQVPYLTDHLIIDLSNFTEGNPLADDISMIIVEAL